MHISIVLLVLLSIDCVASVAVDCGCALVALIFGAARDQATKQPMKPLQTAKIR